MNIKQRLDLIDEQIANEAAKLHQQAAVELAKLHGESSDAIKELGDILATIVTPHINN